MKQVFAVKTLSGKIVNDTVFRNKKDAEKLYREIGNPLNNVATLDVK